VTEPGQGAGAASEAPTLVGEETCRACHSVEARHWAQTIHALAFARNPTRLEQGTCEACHGPGSQHIAEPSRPDSIVRFTHGSKTPVGALNRMCLRCHAGGSRIHWPGSLHENADLACSDCHDPMARQSPRGLLAADAVSSTCFRCHLEVRSQFRKRSHMPVLEGKVSCIDCHAPHGSVEDALLRDDEVALCVRCHADKRGPFLWEHAPAADGCLECHHPHGSNHERLLVSPIPYLCQQCHSQVASFGHAGSALGSNALPTGSLPDPRIANRGCVNCHVQIHGSNHPSGVRFHR
jgi:DmsE family decaheme c-type cytochrome